MTQPKVLKCLVCKEPAKGQKFGNGAHWVWCPRSLSAGGPHCITLVLLPPGEQENPPYEYSSTFSEKDLNLTIRKLVEWTVAMQEFSHTLTQFPEGPWGFDRG